MLCFSAYYEIGLTLTKLEVKYFINTEDNSFRGCLSNGVVGREIMRFTNISPSMESYGISKPVVFSKKQTKKNNINLYIP